MQPLNTKSADGTDLLSAAGVLFLAASAAFDKNHPADARQRATAVAGQLDLFL
ncbi:MAG: hypothetical protein WAV85_16040 [Rhodoferax sp.]